MKFNNKKKNNNNGETHERVTIPETKQRLESKKAIHQAKKQ